MEKSETRKVEESVRVKCVILKSIITDILSLECGERLSMIWLDMACYVIFDVILRRVLLAS